MITSHPEYRAKVLGTPQNLDHARYLARVLAGDLDRLARYLADDPALADDRGRARDLARALERALAFARILDRTLDHDVYRDLAVARAHNLGRELTLAGAIASHFPNDRVRDTAVEAAHYKAMYLAAKLETSKWAVREAEAGRASPTGPAQLAARLTRSAVRILPSGSRLRYDAEFGSELYELAAAGASWGAQLGYAVRLLDRAWVLRAELRETVARRVRS